MRKLTMILAALVALSTTAQAGTILRSKTLGLVNASALRAASSALEGENLYLVQWKGAIRESEKAELESLGLEILSYFPDDAFLVKGDAARAMSLAFINAVVPFGAAFKVEAELTQHGILSANEARRVSIQLVPGSSKEAVLSQLEDAVDVGQGLLVGTATVASLWKIAASKDVLWVERYIPFRNMALTAKELGVEGATAATTTGYESGTKVMNVESIYGRGLTGEGQIVAVADTGLDTGDMTTLSQDFQGQVKKGIAVGLGGKSWGDPMMHGTHCSGSILGNGRASNNLIRGGAYGAKLVMLGMWSDIMNNIMPPAMDKLLETGYGEGVRIQSNSWGAPNSNGRYDNWAVLIDSWLFQHPDYLAMFAAGNDGADLNKDGVIDENTVSSPGSAKNVLTVGASKNLLMEGGIQKQMKDLRNGGDKWGAEPLASSRLSEDVRGMAAFSSRGPTADGRIKPEIVAPGTNIVSARDKHPKADPATMSWGVYDDNYVFMGGTSMATPLAAGAAALTRQFLVQKLGKSNVTSALMKATMANTADDLFPGQFGEIGRGQEQPSRRPNNHEGWGRVNMANLAGGRTFLFADETTGLATGAEKAFTFTGVAGQPLRVTLAYTDAPGVASAQRTLVNDLDLTVTDPSGRTLFPNGRSDKDAVNNMEQIDVLAAAAGTYTVKVRGANVPQGKNGAQPFALVISAGQ